MTYHLFFTFSRKAGLFQTVPPELEASHVRKMRISVQRYDQALGTAVIMALAKPNGMFETVERWDSKEDEARIPPNKDLFTGLVFPAVKAQYSKFLLELSALPV